VVLLAAVYNWPTIPRWTLPKPRSPATVPCLTPPKPRRHAGRERRSRLQTAAKPPPTPPPSLFISDRRCRSRLF